MGRPSPVFQCTLSQLSTHSLREDGLGGGVANAIDVLQRELDVLGVGDFHAAHTGGLDLQRRPPEGYLRAAGRTGRLNRRTSPESIVALQALR